MSANAEVVPTDVRADETDPRFRVFDIADGAATEALIAEEKPTVVVQLAYTLAAACDSDPVAALRVNVAGISSLFAACQKARVNRVVYASSNAVYGDQADHGELEVVEERHGAPRSLYGWMKQLNEAVASHMSSLGDTEFVGVRVGSAFGGARRGGTFNPIADVAQSLLATGTPEVPYAAEHAACFIHVEDVAAIFARLTLAQIIRHQLYNTGGVHFTMAAIADTLGECLGRRVLCARPGRSMSHVSRVSARRLTSEFPDLALRRSVPGEMKMALNELLMDSK